MVTGKQTNRDTGFGLKIPVKYTLYVHEMSPQEKIKKQMDNMNNIKKKHLKWYLVFFCPCPLIRGKLQGKRNSFYAKMFVD